MGAYRYKALNGAGKQVRDVLEADTERAARAALRERGLIPLQVDAVQQRASAQNSAWLHRLSRISGTDQALLTRQLATLLGSGMPLAEALQAVAEQTERDSIKSMLMAIRSQVLQGHTLAKGLQDYPRVFSNLYCATVEAGEQTGHLAPVLERLADYIEGREALRQKTQLALLYPAMLTLTAILVVSGLLTYVVPKVVQVFDNIGQELPGLTIGLINISDFLREQGWLLLMVLVLGSVLFKLGMKRPGFRHRVHSLVLRLPLLGRLTRSINSARFARTFGILNGSGVPVLPSMQIAARVVENSPMRAAVEEAIVQVREGSNIATALARSKQFPPMTTHLIAAGEGSGDLAGMLDHAASTQEREVETRFAAILGIFEPLLILLMGGVVLIIVLAILLPIFDLNQMVN